MVQLYSQVDYRLELIQTFDDHVGSVGQVLFSQNGEKLLSCSSDRTIVIRELVSRESAGAVLVAYASTKILTLKATPISMAWPPGQTDTLVVSTIDRQIQEFDFSTGRSTQAFRASDQEGNDSVVMDALVLWGNPAASQQKTLLAGVASTDKTIRIYAYENSWLLTKEHGHTEGVSGVALMEADHDGTGEPAKTTLVSTGMDGTIMIWEVSSKSHSPLETIDFTDLPCESSPVKELTAIKTPLRRILSKSDLSEFSRTSSPESCTPVVRRTVNRSPPRVRKKTSRYTLSSQSPSIAAPPIPSNHPSPTPLLPDPLGLKDPREGLLAPPSPKLTRPQRPAFNARSRTKSTGNITELGSLDTTTVQLCRSLRAYRKKLSISTNHIPAKEARELESELNLTVEAIGARTRRPQAASEAMVGVLLDQYSERLAQIIDERVAISVAKQTRSDGTVVTSGGWSERQPDLDVVGDG